MTIQWFPGHMAKARREVTENLKMVDIVYELIDARLPRSSRNPMIDDMLGQKARVIVLNKQDMADPRITEGWLAHFREAGAHAVAINSLESRGMKALVRASEELLKEKFDRMKARGIKPRAIRAMIVGIPNVGKSTLINRLAKKNIARTGNTPGVTKAQQWIKVEKQLELLDTPGILWPKFEDQEIGFKLALTGAIKDTLLNMEDLAAYGLRHLAQHYPDRLRERYGLESADGDLAALFDVIGQRRHAIATGGGVDYDQVAELIVRDIRNQHLGPLSFDFPDATDRQ